MTGSECKSECEMARSNCEIERGKRGSKCESECEMARSNCEMGKGERGRECEMAESKLEMGRSDCEMGKGERGSECEMARSERGSESEMVGSECWTLQSEGRRVGLMLESERRVSENKKYVVKIGCCMIESEC